MFYGVHSYTILKYKAKTKYGHLYSIANTSIKRAFSLQSTPMLKIVDAVLDHERELIVSSFLKDSPREKEIVRINT